ncbi:unnamed protein product [Ranitomeya imitator]|uniref:Adhesion GPCR Gpr126 SEA domain-containing protein n=1 Tax=Ranitomeya imitator TaxID=111125 RepID=A0ABN9L8M6_9NEOB|nr:unnamed protein product [Ranitomeya imitator]
MKKSIRVVKAHGFLQGGTFYRISITVVIDANELKVQNLVSQWLNHTFQNWDYKVFVVNISVTPVNDGNRRRTRDVSSVIDNRAILQDFPEVPETTKMKGKFTSGMGVFSCLRNFVNNKKIHIYTYGRKQIQQQLHLYYVQKILDTQHQEHGETFENFSNKGPNEDIQASLEPLD